MTSGARAELWRWWWRWRRRRRRRRPAGSGSVSGSVSGSGSPEQGERAAVAAARGRAAPGASRPSLALGPSALLRPLLLTALAGSRQRAPGEGGAVGEAGGPGGWGLAGGGSGLRAGAGAHGRRRAGGIRLLPLAVGGGAAQTVGRRLRRCFRGPVTQSPGRAAPGSLAPADRWGSRPEALGCQHGLGDPASGLSAVHLGGRGGRKGGRAARTAVPVLAGGATREVLYRPFKSVLSLLYLVIYIFSFLPAFLRKSLPTQL